MLTAAQPGLPWQQPRVPLPWGSPHAAPPFPGHTGVCQFPPRHICPLSVHPAVSVCLSVSLSVHVTPPPSTPGHCLVPCPPRGVPCPPCLCGGDHTRVTPPRAMLGVPGVAALPRPPAWQPHAKGGRSGAPSCCQAASAHCVPQFPPFLVGGWNSVSLPAKCFETHLPPQQPGSGQWGPPTPGGGTSLIYVTPQPLFKKTRQSVFYLFILMGVWGDSPPSLGSL